MLVYTAVQQEQTGTGRLRVVVLFSVCVVHGWMCLGVWGCVGGAFVSGGCVWFWVVGMRAPRLAEYYVCVTMRSTINEPANFSGVFSMVRACGVL